VDLVLDPYDLFTVVAEPELDGPVLVQALDGFVDAGGGRRLAREHLLDALDSELVVTFDHDQLFDYRSRRPEMSFTTDHWDGYAAPELAIHLVRDLDEKPFLLLHGPEPDVQWERFISAVGLIVERFGVSLMVGMNSIPMGIPHTRPATVIAHGTPPSLVADYPKWLPTIQVPASIGNLLEYRLGGAGTPSCGFAVAVPHYLAHLDYPDAAAALVGCVADAGALSLPVDALTHAGEAVRANVDSQVAESDDIAKVVQTLEAQYDAMQAGRGHQSLLAEGTRLPTADEIGAEFERFLSSQPDSEDPPQG